MANTGNSLMWAWNKMMEQDGVIQRLTERNNNLQRQVGEIQAYRTQVQDLTTQNQALVEATHKVQTVVGERDTAIERLKEQSLIEEQKREGLKDSISKLIREKESITAKVASLKTAQATSNGKLLNIC